MSDHHIIATNKATGEVVELPTSTLKEVVAAWRVAQEYEKTATALKEQLKKLVPKFINEKGASDEVSGFMFRSSNIQRLTYDKAVMRAKLDPDAFDVLMKPDKTAVDKYLKENLEALGSVSTELRDTMIPEGSPYQVIKLERLDRDA